MLKPLAFYRERNISKEIAALARHQLGILMRRFPNYEHKFYEFGSSHGLMMIIISSNNCLLQIQFHSDRIEIVSSFGESGVSAEEIVTIEIEGLVIVKYADPKFTDDTISDTLKAWEVRHSVIL